jgi:hypothetical protein
MSLITEKQYLSICNSSTKNMFFLITYITFCPGPVRNFVLVSPISYLKTDTTVYAKKKVTPRKKYAVSKTLITQLLNVVFA